VFGRGLWPFIAEITGAGAAAISLDHSQPLEEARARLRQIGSEAALQGNLAPEVLRGPAEDAGAAARSLLRRWREIVPHPDRAGELGPTGWVFNLGHGVPADADPAAVEAVVQAVRRSEAEGVR
jgi:uroporphyrinogen decarboxylase